MSQLLRPRTRVRRRAVAALALALVPALGLPAVSVADGQRSHESDARRMQPVVKHTGKAPTGYTVTFRYYDKTATRVQIKGEWSFERPSELEQVAGSPGQVVQTPNIQPADWLPGDVPIQSPNSTNPNFPVHDMREIGNSGVWTFTTPLPSGVFVYNFFVDCTTADQAGCTPLPDPANPAFTTAEGNTDTSPITVSTVYVPSDPDFNTVDYSWQGPAERAGTMRHLRYPSPGHVTPSGENYAVVYTPPGYDRRRPEPYPTLYLSHGGGEAEMGWAIQGNLQNIMDNLIATGEIEPMVVVLTNGNGYPASVDNQAYRSDLVDNLIPFIERSFHVSAAAADRAYSGLSAGGTRTNQFMLLDPEVFGYYGVMSAGLPPGTTVSPGQVEALQHASVYLGAGWQDSIFGDGFVLNGVQRHTGPAKEVSILEDAGLHVTTEFIHGGHNWYVWRILLKGFLTRVAFLPKNEADW
jgi:enterochelin esterase-like enzyme